MSLPIRLTAFAALSVLASGAVAQQAPSANAQQPRLRAQVTKDLNSQFSAIDSNRDGSLSNAEMDAARIRAAQQRTAAIRAGVNAQFTQLDTNRDGQLSRAEFMAAAPRPPSALPTATAIQRLDANKDGKVSLQEFSAPSLAIFNRFDVNKDGALSPQERQAAARAARGRRR